MQDLNHSRPTAQILRSEDGNPIILSSEKHPYRGILQEQYVMKHACTHGHSGDAGLIEDCAPDIMVMLGLALLKYLWDAAEFVIGGCEMRPWRDQHRTFTNIVFTHDSCGSRDHDGPEQGNSGDRWCQYLKTHNFHVIFTVPLDPPADVTGSDDLQSKDVLCTGGQARERRNELFDLRRRIHDGEIVPRFTCCSPPDHPLTVDVID